MDHPLFAELSTMAVRQASAAEFQALAPDVPADFPWPTWLYLMLAGGHIVGAWTAIQNVRPKMTKENTALLSAEMHNVISFIGGGLQTLSIVARWPKRAQPLPVAIKYQYLEAVKVRKPEEEWKGLQMSLRSGRNKNGNMRAEKAISEWTGPSYQGVQKLMRGGNGLEMHRQQAQNMRAYFDRIVTVTPGGVPKGTKYLYRGVAGPAARAMELNGHYRDSGFNAFSRDIEQAREFAMNYEPVTIWPEGKGGFPVVTFDKNKPLGTAGCLLMCLAVKDIEQGTPLVWFDLKNKPKSGMPEQQEVLFPPGTLTVLPGGTDGYMVPVKYQRDHAFLGR